jgi:UDP-glucuronate 4-epimerase
MIEAIGAGLGRAPDIDRQPEQPGDVRRTWADLARSGRELGYAPKVPFEEGLRRQWAWLQESVAVGGGAG